MIYNLIIINHKKISINNIKHIKQYENTFTIF